MGDSRFIGTWRLVTFDLRDGANNLSYPYGGDAVGYISYGADDFVHVQIMSSHRANFPSTVFSQATESQRASAFATVLAYCGRYELKKDKVVHHVEICTVPNMVNSSQERSFEFKGNRLTLSGPLGPRHIAHLIWERN